MKKRIVLFGPGPFFKGGLANYNISLARAMDALGCWEVHLVSWIQQYPAIIPRDFADKSSQEDKLSGTNVQLHYLTDYNKPGTWKKTADFILELNPACVVIQWSIAIQGLPLGFMVKRIKKHSQMEVLFDLHFVIQKEQTFIDQYFTKFALRHPSGFVVHAGKTIDELKQLFPHQKWSITTEGQRPADPGNSGKVVIKLFHPVYDMFKPRADFDVASYRKQNGLQNHVFLFFGFIRKYKGLHFCLKAFAQLAAKRNDVSLYVVGESFWKTLDESRWTTRLKKAVFNTLKKIMAGGKENETDYNPLSLIDELGIRDKVKVVNDFVPNEAVYQYFQASDCILLFYEYATPSGVESMAYNFKKPILATKVGHFPETIIDGENGYLAAADQVDDMAMVMERFIENPIPESNMEHMARQFSWKIYARAISLPYLD